MEEGACHAAADRGKLIDHDDMMRELEELIEEITRQHNHKVFDCGVTELDQFLQQHNL